MIARPGKTTVLDQTLAGIDHRAPRRIAEGRQVLAVAPHVTTIPGVMIFLVTLGLNAVGDVLRDALDPRLQY